MAAFRFALPEKTNAMHVHEKIPLKPLTADFSVSLNVKYKSHGYTGGRGYKRHYDRAGLPKAP